MHPNAPCVFEDVDRDDRAMAYVGDFEGTKTRVTGVPDETYRNAGQGMSSLIMLLKCVQDTWQREFSLCPARVPTFYSDPLRWHVFLSNIQRYIYPAIKRLSGI